LEKLRTIGTSMDMMQHFQKSMCEATKKFATNVGEDSPFMVLWELDSCDSLTVHGIGREWEAHSQNL
jgi:hypothetical protein